MSQRKAEYHQMALPGLPDGFHGARRHVDIVRRYPTAPVYDLSEIGRKGVSRAVVVPARVSAKQSAPKLPVAVKPESGDAFADRLSRLR